MKVKNTFKKAIAAIEVAAMTLALVGGLSIANTTEVLAAGGTLTLNVGTEIVSDSAEVLTFTAPASGTYYFYSETTGFYDPYADLVTETDEYYSDDERDLDFWIEVELSEGEECELTVSSYEADDGEEYETTVYVRDKASAQDMLYQVEGGGSQFINMGDSHELSVELKNLAGEVMETIPEGCSIKWTKENENGEETELDGASNTYIIDKITDEDLCSGKTDYVCFVATIYEGEVELDAVYFYLYDMETSVSMSGDYEYASVGEKVTFTATVYDYNYDEINLEEKSNYTYKWYRATENEDGDWDKYEEIKGATGYSYTVDVTAADFSEEANDYVCYICELYINGEKIDYSTFMINDKEKYINVLGNSYYINEGDSVTLQPEIYDYNENEIDINDENLEFTWYTYNEEYDEVVLGNSPTLTIENISFSDSEELYYYVEIIYKGVTYEWASLYIYNSYTSFYGGYDDIAATIGENLTLEAKITDYNDNLVTEFDDSFTFEWYKTTYDEVTDEDIYSEVLGTGTTYEIKSVEESDINCEDTGYATYICEVYRDGNRITSYEARILNVATYWTVEESENIFAAVGDEVTFKPTIYDAEGKEIDINDERFTYEWYDTDYGYLGSDSTYTIDSVTENDFCDSEDYESYEVYIYDDLSERTQWASFYLYKAEGGDEPTTKEPTTEAPTTVDTTTDVPPTTVAPTTATTEKVTKPAKAKIKKVTPKKKSSKKVKLSLKKIKGANGYQVAIYKTKNNAKINKKALVKKIVRKTKVTIKSKKLKNKNKLFVKVRAYALDGKTKRYGKWSNIKKIKVKK